MLDDFRKRNLQILSSSSSFELTFHQITNGILMGLNWNNLLLAGDMVLTTLMHTNSGIKDEKALGDPELDIYVYGLGPEDANRKVEAIHNTWVANLPASAERLVVKSANAITLIPSYPHRRIRIELKLFLDPIDVLLDIDLDPYAVSFDGSSVSMLPRCARAMETGYSTFINDLVFDHHLSGRQATTEKRIFACAKRGFGLRFLPSWPRYLEQDQCTSQEAARWFVEAAHTRPLLREQRDRYPFGTMEPGLLTLKRIAYLGRDYVHRSTFGPTVLTTYPGQQRLPSRDNDGIQSDDYNAWTDEEQWQRCVKEVCASLDRAQDDSWRFFFTPTA